MPITLEEITFNHDPDSATCDAFNIRRNETELVDTPEWRRGVSINPEDSPAAYARNEVNNQTLTIKAKFSCDSPCEKVWIRALDGRLDPVNTGHGIRFVAAVLRPLLRRLLGSNVLGEVRASKVEFHENESGSVSFDLQNVRIQQAGVGIDDIVWRWQFSANGWNWNELTTTTHRVYTVVEMPGLPWEPNSDKSNTQLPWIPVLDHACRWAAGTVDLESAAFQITKSINLLGPAFLEYDTANNGSPYFAYDYPNSPDYPHRFDCQTFLDLLKSPKSNHRLVNCEDCAAMVCAFANVLGCGFPESIILSPNSPEFSLRRHQKIGLGWKNFDQFGFHAVAWTGSDPDKVSDACLKLDGSDCDAGDPIPVVASNIPFVGEDGYRHLLVQPGQDCQLQEQFYRRIGLSVPPKVPAIGTAILKAKQQALLLLEAFSHLPALGNLIRIDLRYVPEDTLEMNWKMTKGPNKSILRLNVQVAATQEGAEANLNHQRGRFELPGVRETEHTGFGKKVFANDSGFVILFLRNQLVCLLRNVGSTLAPMWEAARMIDDLLLNLPNHSIQIANTSFKGGH